MTVLPEPLKVELKRKTDIQFRKLTLSQGLSQTRVGKIIQDNAGYVWLGAQVGANRFDGYNFRVFKQDRDNPDGLSGVYIYSMFKDRTGKIWIGTDQLLDAFDDATGTFRHYVIDATTPSVLQISQDKEGLLWLSTSQGLYRLDPLSGKVTRFGHVDGDPLSLSSDDVKSTGTDKNGTFWVATANGLEAFDSSSGRVSMRIPLRMEAREFEFFEDSHGLFWIFYGSGSGLALYDKATDTVRKLSFSNADDGLSGIYRMIETREGELWFASMGAGLLKFNRDDFTFDQYVNDPTDPQSLTEDRVIELYEDHQGNIWAGLHSNPPVVFTRKPLPFKRIWPFPSTVNKLGETFVNAVLEDHLGNVWMGLGGALHRIDKYGNLKVFDVSGQNRSVEILSIVEDRQGVLWIGTIGTGLISFDPVTRQTTTYRYEKGKPDWISSDVVPRIVIGDDGIIWMSTWNGLDRFDPKLGTFKAYRADSSLNKEFFAIVSDGRGNLWISSRVGLVKFEIASERFTEFHHDPNDPTSISNNTVNNIFDDRDGNLWLGTHNGLTEFDTATGKSKAFFEKDGLAGSSISCILQDPRGNLWLSTNRGVSRRDAKTGAFLNYTTVDGLPGDDMGGWQSCAAGAEGRLYFAGFPGAAVTNPGYVERADAPMPIAFTDIKIGDKSALYPIRRPDDPYRLAYDQSLTLTFAALNFNNPVGTRYRYKLTGFDTDWHTVPSTQRTINYAALPAGEFTLDVQAATERGDWMPNGARLSIAVAPPWWRAWWFYAFSIVLTATIVAVVYRIRLMQIAAIYNLRLEERLGERTRVARDLHDTLLQSFQGLTYRLEAVRNLLPDEPQKAANQLEVILRKSDDAIIEGRETIQSLRDPANVTSDLIAAVNADAEELAAGEHGGKIPEFSSIVEGPVEKFPSDIRHELRLICREALRNAFTHSSSTHIDCAFRYAAGNAIITVKDNGKGILSEDALSRKSGHFGISGMRERAARIGAEVRIDSANGLGTKVEISITTNPARLASLSRRFRGEPEKI